MTTMSMDQTIVDQINAINPGPLYRSAIEEVAESIAPVIAENKTYQQARVFERLLIPDRVIRFRVEWVNDQGGVEVNFGWLGNTVVQFFTIKSEWKESFLNCEACRSTIQMRCNVHLDTVMHHCKWYT